MPKKAFETLRNISVLFGGTFAFIIEILAIMLLEKGLTLGEIGLYFGLGSLSLLLLEVPTGAFADAYGRKKAIILGFVFEIVFLAAFLFLPEGEIFLALAFVAALAESMMSGSIEAFVVDMLSEKGKMDYTHKLLTSGVWWKHLTFLGGAIIGGYLATISMDYPVIICLAFAIIGLVYSVLRLKEKHATKDFETSEKKIVKKIMMSLDFSVKNKSLRTIHILSLILGLGTFGFFTYWQPVMRDLAGWGTDSLGLFFAVISISMMVGSEISPRFKASWGNIVLIFMGMAVFLFAAGSVSVPFAVAVLIVFWEMLWGMYMPLEGAIINHSSPSILRATMISIKAMSYRFGWALFGFSVFAFGADSPRSFWIIGAVFLVIGALIILKKRSRRDMAYVSG